MSKIYLPRGECMLTIRSVLLSMMRSLALARRRVAIGVLSAGLGLMGVTIACNRGGSGGRDVIEGCEADPLYGPGSECETDDDCVERYGSGSRCRQDSITNECGERWYWGTCDQNDVAADERGEDVVAESPDTCVSTPPTEDSCRNDSECVLVRGPGWTCVEVWDVNACGQPELYLRYCQPPGEGDGDPVDVVDAPGSDLVPE